MISAAPQMDREGVEHKNEVDLHPISISGFGSRRRGQFVRWMDARSEGQSREKERKEGAK